jgi:Cu+-exporting ATPase
MSSPLPSPSCQVIELPVRGMDCAECSQHVQQALAAIPGVESVTILLASEKAVLRLDPTQVPLSALAQAVKAAGYEVEAPDTLARAETFSLTRFTRPVLTLFGLLVGAVLLIVIVGEWLGFFERVTEVVPWPVGVALVLVAGAPIFWTVLRAALRRQILSHTLMSLGVVAALAVGQWPTAAVVVFFMHTGTFVEFFTTERSRQALKRLTSLVPKLARVEQQGEEVEVPVEAVQVRLLHCLRFFRTKCDDAAFLVQ